MRSRRTVVLVVSAVVLVGAGAGAVAWAQGSPSPTPSSEGSRTATVGWEGFLDDVAARLGVDRSRLDEAFEAMALADVRFAEEGGFITKQQADAARRAIRSGRARASGHHTEGRPGRGFWFGTGLRFGPPGLPFPGAPFEGHVGPGPESLTAAARFLGMSPAALAEALGSKTLAQVARDRGKPVSGLERVLRDAKVRELDRAVSDGFLSRTQETALLDRFDSEVGDVVNGISPRVTELAERLGVDRSDLIEAIEGAARDQVDAAAAKGYLTKAQAAAVKRRIDRAPGASLAFPGPCGLGLGFGPPGFAFGRPALPLPRPRFGFPRAPGDFPPFGPGSVAPAW